MSILAAPREALKFI